jgi:carbon storage regulator
MLVLSRRKDESIILPDLGITIEVIRVKGNKVRLGIKAPDSVRILRSELEAIAGEFENSNPLLDRSSCVESVHVAAK